MFAGLLLTAGVAYVVQSNPKLLEFADGNFFLLFIAQLGIVMVIAGAINRISATAALALFFVYAASLGITIGLIVASYTDGLGRHGVPERVGDVRRGGHLRRRHQALARAASAASCSWAYRAARRDAGEHVPAAARRSPA